MNQAGVTFALVLLWLFCEPWVCLIRIENRSGVGTRTCQTKQTNDAPGSMVFLRGGTTRMGIDAGEVQHFTRIFAVSDPQLFRDELPRHQVKLDDFYLDRYLVTEAEFFKFVDANPQWKPSRLPAHLDNGNYLKHWQGSNTFDSNSQHPVVNVNWYAAVAYCRWTGKRLPTEAEWEYAARGGYEVLFPWGNEHADRTRANYSGAGLHATTPVGTYPPNPYALFDMAGNVWEYLADEWHPYPSIAQTNPIAGGDRFKSGTAFLQVKTRRVIRGGSFEGDPINLWVEYRDSHPPDGSRPFVGFRCAK
jgi:formylglycine-generating enzyme